MIIKNPVPLQLYVSKEEKEAFKRACFQADTTMSRELRRYIRSFALNPPRADRLYYQILIDQD